MPSAFFSILKMLILPIIGGHAMMLLGLSHELMVAMVVLMSLPVILPYNCLYQATGGLPMTDEELVSKFHTMWDGFPGLARLIDARHNVLAANPVAAEKGFVEGVMCAKVGSPELHSKCKLARFFNSGQAVIDHVLDDRVRGWMPVAGRDDVCIHFAVMIPEK